jgi:hypothetical protein
MFILDGLRQKDYCRQLIESARQRWPDLRWTDCDDSLPLHGRLVEHGIATPLQRGYFRFVPKSSAHEHPKVQPE